MGIARGLSVTFLCPVSRTLVESETPPLICISKWTQMLEFCGCDEVEVSLIDRLKKKQKI